MMTAPQLRASTFYEISQSCEITTMVLFIEVLLQAILIFSSLQYYGEFCVDS